MYHRKKNVKDSFCNNIYNILCLKKILEDKKINYFNLDLFSYMCYFN